MHGRFSLLAIATLLGALGPAGATLAPAAAAPTPIPGGANGISAVSARLGTTVFNGMLRVKIMLRDGTPAEVADVKPTADQKVMYIESFLSNGTHDDFISFVTYTLADKDGISVQIPYNAFTPQTIHILQGASERQTQAFAIDKNFVPVKLIVQCSTCSDHTAFRPIRFTIPAAN